MNDSRPQPFLITLLRHGESVGNAESRRQGQADFPLTQTGHRQVASLAERWRNEGEAFDHIISSPLLRARETAELLARSFSLTVEFESLWLERDTGEFSGLTREEVRQNYQPASFITPYDPIGVDGEGDWELFLRAGQALLSLLKREPARYLIVSHGGLLNQFMHAVVGMAPQANDSGTRFRFENSAFAKLSYFPHQHRWVIDRLNDHAHLQDAG
jgi:broad specificity phosphatase PhoE